jgi:asparagine synthase (glutamine-hydrolysing)
VLQQRTLFPGVSLLPGGASWRFARDRPVRKDSYFDRRSWEAQATLSPEDFYGKLKEAFPRVLARYLRPKGDVAMSITGGLDTRCIMAWAHCAPGELPCYTFGGSYRECEDVRIGRRVARACQQKHTLIPVTREFPADFPALAEQTVYYTDGVMDVSGAVELYVNRLAREIAPVRLTGNYGDEVLRGVIPFRPVTLCEDVFAREFVGNLRRAEETYAHETAGRRNSFIAFKQVPWHHYSRLSLERTQLTIRSPYLDNELVALAYQAPPELASSPRLALQLIAEGNAALSRIGTDRGVLLRPIPLITGIHRCWREFTFKAEYMYDYGMPQWLAAIDHRLAPLRPERLFLGRHKFYHFRVWYRDAMGRYLRDMLLAPRARGRPYIRADVLERMVNSHISGRRNYTYELHRLLTAELMQRLLIEQK